MEGGCSLFPTQYLHAGHALALEMPSVATSQPSGGLGMHPAFMRSFFEICAQIPVRRQCYYWSLKTMPEC